MLGISSRTNQPPVATQHHPAVSHILCCISHISQHNTVSWVWCCPDNHNLSPTKDLSCELNPRVSSYGRIEPSYQCIICICWNDSSITDTVTSQVSSTGLSRFTFLILKCLNRPRLFWVAYRSWSVLGNMIKLKHQFSSGKWYNTESASRRVSRTSSTFDKIAI